MKNKLFNILLPAVTASSFFLLTGCGDGGCGLDKAPVDLVSDQILQVLVKDIEEGKAAKTLRNTNGLEFLVFQECTIPGNTQSCKGIEKEGISFLQGSDEYAARTEWVEVNSLPDSMNLIVASRNTICTYPVFSQGKINPSYRDGACVKNPQCKEDEGWF